MLKLLGRGSFGRVFLAQQKLTNRLVAIKVIEKDRAGDEEARQKVRLEVEVLRRVCGHPHLLHLLEAFEDEKRVFVVTDFAS